MELQQGLYAVVTVGHLLLLACRTTSAAGAGTAPNSGATSKGAAAQQQQRQLEQPAAQQEPELVGAAAAPAEQQQLDQQQQQRAVCVQYKDPQLVFVLDLRDVMMVAAEGSSLRLLCMAGDPAASATAVADNAAREALAAAAGTPSGADDGSGSAADAGAGDPLVREGSGSAAGGAMGGEGRGDGGLATSGLRELLAVAGAGSRSSGSGVGAGFGRLQQRLPLSARAGFSVPTAAGAGGQSSVQGVCSSRWQAVGRGVASITDAELESAAAGAAAAVAAAVGGGVMGMPEVPERLLPGTGGVCEGGGSNAAAHPGPWGGCKWFVGHQVPCGSDDAALQLQQLLKRSCQRVETLLASSAWPRQLML